MSLTFAKEVMALPLDPDDKNFPKILGTKQAVAASILTASVRVNDGALRAKNEDRIAALLAEVKASAG
jgi:hypothetical protein